MKLSNLLIKSYKSITNFGYGYQSSVLVIEFEKSSFIELEKPEKLTTILQGQYLKIYPNKCHLLNEAIDLTGNLMSCLCDWAYIFQKGSLIDHSDEKNLILIIPAPKSVHMILVQLIQWLVQFYNSAEIFDDFGKNSQTITNIINQLSKFSVVSSNLPHLLEAASKLDIPVLELGGGVSQYGQGKHSIWLNSTFTDKTPHIGTSLARDKHTSSKILFNAGLPVPPHALVQNIQQATVAAEKIGYPVVIKPVSLDGGLGVAAGLRNSDAVIKAFNDAKKYNSPIMLQKHIFGRDYRLTVFQGKLLWAVERVPGCVDGDGVNTIKVLVDKLNSNPQRGEGEHAILKKILLDAEALSLLQECHKTVDSVPEKGERVILRRRANVNAGGMPIAVMDIVHIDNQKLAIRAAELLRLDLAGIDLLISDISKSWMDVGASICEVNAQPSIGSLTAKHTYSIILKTLLPKGGRIPIAVVIGSQNSFESDELFNKYIEDGFMCGYVSRKGLFIGYEKISNVLISNFHSAQALILDKRIEALVIDVTDYSFVELGFPFDKIDILISSQQLQAIEGVESGDLQVVFKKQKLMIEMHADKVINV